jgi:hypothetical protein
MRCLRRSLARILALQEQRQRLVHVEVGTRGIVEQAVELIADAKQLELAKQCQKPVIVGRYLQKPPPI